MKKLVRDNVLRIEHYEPGLPIEVLRKELGLEGKISKLASNENPLGPSPLAVRAVRKTLEEGNLYPDNSCTLLREKIAERIGVSKENVGIGNGSTELIFLMGIAFLNPGDAFITSECSFIMAKIIAQFQDSNLKLIPLREFRHDLEEILKAVTDNTKIVYLDNPMNPIGTMITEDEVSQFMEKIPEEVVVVFDEAYYQYASQGKFPDTLKYVREGRNVIVLRTFSKSYGLAGLRVGYCVAGKNFINIFQRITPPFSVNRLAQVAAAAALDDEKHLKRTLEVTQSGKKLLYKNFEAMSVFYIPSETNFVTIDIKADAKKAAQDLMKKGIIVRPLSMYGKPTFLRITVGTPRQNKRFLAAFKDIYQQLHIKPTKEQEDLPRTQ